MNDSIFPSAQDGRFADMTQDSHPDQGLLIPSQALKRFSTPQSWHLKRSEEKRPRFGFRIGPIGLLIAPSTIAEVIVRPQIFPVPNTPFWMNGLMNLRGTLVPVFDLYAICEFEGEDHAERGLCLVLDKGEAAAGVLIAVPPQSLDLSRKLRQPPPMTAALSEHVAEAYIFQGVAWCEFNHESFFTALGKRIGS